MNPERDRVAELDAAVFGVRGEGGLVQRVDGLEKLLARHYLTLLAAIGTACLTLMALVIQLVIALSQGGHG